MKRFKSKGAIFIQLDSCLTAELCCFSCLEGVYQGQKKKTSLPNFDSE